MNIKVNSKLLRVNFLTLFFFIIVCVSSTYAVNPGESSWTAASATAFRAIASMDPDEKIRNPDYMAVKFIAPEF